MYLRQAKLIAGVSSGYDSPYLDVLAPGPVEVDADAVFCSRPPDLPQTVALEVTYKPSLVQHEHMCAPYNV